MLFTATQFYLDIIGHPDEPAVKRAMEELSYFTTDVKILGVYERDLSKLASKNLKLKDSIQIVNDKIFLLFTIWKTAIKTAKTNKYKKILFLIITIFLNCRKLI